MSADAELDRVLWQGRHCRLSARAYGGGRRDGHMLWLTRIEGSEHVETLISFHLRADRRLDGVVQTLVDIGTRVDALVEGGWSVRVGNASCREVRARDGEVALRWHNGASRAIRASGVRLSPAMLRRLRRRLERVPSTPEQWRADQRRSLDRKEAGVQRIESRRSSRADALDRLGQQLGAPQYQSLAERVLARHPDLTGRQLVAAIERADPEQPVDDAYVDALVEGERSFDASGRS